MSASPQIKRISPILAVADMAETLSFYQSVAGFTVTMEDPAYSIPSSNEMAPRSIS